MTTGSPSAHSLLRASAHRSMPWKNGGGVTTEIAIEPPGAGLDTFQWRLSMARIEAPGRFSVFPGVDRLLLALEGRLDLVIDGAPLTLTPADAALSFRGEADVGVIAPAGRFEPALDFNLMIRRGGPTAQLHRLAFADAAEFKCRAETTLVLSRTDKVQLRKDATMETLDKNDALLMRDSASRSVSFHSPERAEVVICEIDLK